MAQVVIADTGPLIAFAAIDRLPVLQALFSKVVITGSVRNEYASKPGMDTRRIDGAIADGWLAVQMAETSSDPRSPSLGEGESDSIRLAVKDAGNTLLVVDDRLARRYALRKGLNILGTARLLHVAQRRGLISDAGQCARDMAEIGYRISPERLEKVRAADLDRRGG
jgi:predicted nucleic acid-binding protein